jgi:uncharacterized membrane protein HdeD (DUF308 family)
VLLIGLSGLYFSVPKNDTLWGLAFIVSFVFTILDVRNTFKKMKKMHAAILFLLIINNIVDAILELGMAGFLFKFNIPYLSAYLNPYLAQPQMLLYLGVYFIVTGVFWLYETHHKKLQ